ncbi:MAG: TonB-dependent receptor [Bacteroidia bacterium]|nr:TonB-dependent receptor [Bacteroidia bacterium]
MYSFNPIPLVLRGRFLLSLLFFSLLSYSAYSQKGIIKGRLFNEISNQPLSFGTILIQGTNKGTFTDSLGKFELKNLEPGLVNLEARYAGFKSRIVYEIQVTNSKPYVLEIGLIRDEVNTDSVVIVASPFKRLDESPLSLQTIGTAEIKRNPGGNRDISRVIQSLPGVSSTASFRNDILIRGGAPNENRFYIDGIEIPNINHFQTQGSSGGPVGLINVDFIGEVDFYSGAFPVNRGNALSSVFEFKQRPARDDRLGFTATLGSSDLALTLEGPSGENSSFLFSARRSYLQLLFRVIGLPFLPTYNDYQYKHKFKLGQRHELNIVSLGAIDQFNLNLDADTTDFQKYILGNLPVQTQWNYAIGANYKYFGDKGFLNLVLSRNMINYNSFKFFDNDESNEKIFDYTSQESENKFRAEYTRRSNGWKLNTGVNVEYDRFTIDNFVQQPFGTIDFTSKLTLFRYGAFVQGSKKLLKERLILSVGTRIDGLDFNENMRNPLNQFSPRFSASFGLTKNLNLNFNTGIYYQTPSYTVMGYRDTETNELVNRDITYIRNQQLVGGLSYTTKNNQKFSVEAFYKKYNNYPFLTERGISLANLGGDFGVIGNEPATSTSEGRAYGLELLAQQRFYKGFYGILAYTLSWSEFSDEEGNYAFSSWDNRHLISLTAGKKFKGNWEAGVKWRYNSGTPFTPANVDSSVLVAVWNVNGREIPDWTQINSGRIASFSQVDIRVDKKWYFQKWSFNLFLDIQNILNAAIPGPPVLDVVRDEDGFPLINESQPDSYQFQFLENNLGVFQPTIGIIITY